MARQIDKPYCNGTWSRAKYFGFIRSALRQATMRFPVKQMVLVENRRPYNGEDKRTKWEYECLHCKHWLKRKDVEVDHIKPAGTLTCYEDLPRFVRNLYCEKDNLRILCCQCHAIVTNEQRSK